MKNIYTYVSIIAMSLLVMEIIYCFITKKDYYSFQEFLMNLGTAIVNQFTNLVVLFLVLISYGWIEENLAFTTIELTITSGILLMLGIDFIFYWVHRWAHSINILWAAHSPHHSAEEMNLGVALRASVTMRLASFFFFWPLAIIGFKPEHIYMFSGLQLLIAFWHHTRVIKKMPGFEVIFNSPSHHRVHHGTNEKYLDKNFGEVLVIWDKMFGTFEPEDDNVPVCYGILRHPKSWSIFTINFHFWSLLWQDCKETKSYWNKFRLWFMPLGWRPPDVKSPREMVKPYDLSQQVKFRTNFNEKFRSYLILNLIICLYAMMSIINLTNDLSNVARILSSMFITFNIHLWSHALSTKNNWLQIENLFSIILAAFLVTSSFEIIKLNNALVISFISLIVLKMVYLNILSIKNLVNINR